MTKIESLTKNYTNLYNEYIKYKDVKVIKNGKTCEDLFQEKILKYIEHLTATHQLNSIQPELDTINEFKYFVIQIDKEPKNRLVNSNYQYIDGLLYDNYSEDYEIEQKEKLKYLFIDYQPQKNNTK